MAWIADPQMWIALITLTALELVLGIDNVIFISILAGKLPADQQQRGRVIGLALAMVTRIALLLSLSWMIHLTEPLFSVLGRDVSGRDLILILGGMFLIGKSTHEIHNKLEGEGDEPHLSKRRATLRRVVIEIMLIDIVFSLLVITAVGMVGSGSGDGRGDHHRGDRDDDLPRVSAFVERHPTVKMLALSFRS
jgi:predicted tellurium resistance membrane protein TerC